MKYLVAAIVTVLCAAACSTKKNTGGARFWHGFTAHYNIYYNGAQAYIEGSLEKEKGNKDNFTERLPLYTVGNKASRELGKAQYDIAITKSQKAIQLHSIKAKPEWTKNRRKTAKDIEWLSRKEYNPFLWKAWMLMGRSQFYKGEFDEAAATFSYMSRLYSTQPAIYGKARAWLAKCYIESDWLYDAEDVIRNMRRDSIDWRAQKEWDYTLCDYYLHTDSLPLAAKYLRRVIKHEMRSAQRAREYFILGQLETAMGNREAAYKAYKKVIAQHPDYELTFNARIAMTEVTAAQKGKAMISRLRRMARNDNNKDYLDQVYYAIGNIYLTQNDTLNAIAAYEKGNEKAVRSGVEKGVLLLRLGDLYWAMEKYSDAGRVYGEAIGLLDKEREGYDELASRSKVLDELVPYTSAIELQDSLQQLAKMSEKDRNDAIDRVIEQLKKKEKEEKAKAAEVEAAKLREKYGSEIASKAMQTVQSTTSTNKTTTWYFYNPQTVQQGKQTFQRTWGKRENVDNWQRVNRTVVGEEMAEEPIDTTNMSQEQRDSLALVMHNDSIAAEKMDSAVNDPHKREYYMAQIPFTEEQVAESNEIIKDALWHSAIIFKDKLDNLPLSKKQFDRLQNDFPDFTPRDELLYHLFLLYSRMGDVTTANEMKEKMQTECPESKLTTLITDPYFADNARYGTHLEDSLYGATYDAFRRDSFAEVYSNARTSAERFPLGANRDRFLFFEGMTKLNDGDAQACVTNMERIVKEYPQSAVAEMAGMIVNGVKAGKRLHGAKFDLSDVWNRRDLTLTGNDSVAQRTFSDDRNTDYLFIMAYAPDSINENKLLFQMARYNFTSFLVRNFDLTIEEMNGMHHFTVSGFRNFDEARQYASLLLQQESVRNVMANQVRPIVISPENLELIGTRYSYNDYDTFYVAHLAPLPLERPADLYEPTPVSGDKQVDIETDKPALPTEEVAPGGAKPEPPRSEEDEEDLIEATDNWLDIGTEPQETTVSEQESVVDEPQNVVVEPEESVVVEQESVVDEPQNVVVEPEESVVVEQESVVDEPQETITVPDESVQPQQQDDILIIDDGANAATDDDGTIIVNDDNATPGGATDDGEEIIFNDERPSTDALEDEYYELEGF